MLNIGPRGDGSVPEHAADSLRGSGEWIKRHPAVVYGADPSPWGHALPWGDVTVRDNKLFLSVFDRPTDGKLHLPGLKTEIRSARWLTANGSEPVTHQRDGTWTCLTLPPGTLNALVPVIEVTLAAPPEVDRTFGIDPKGPTELDVHFASVKGATRNSKRWMEKFGEWKHTVEVTDWKADGAATWEVDVLRPGHYRVDLTYTGEERLVWRVAVEGGQAIQNQQNASPIYQSFPIGWLEFTTPGRHRISVGCIDGNITTASLKSLRLTLVTDLSPTSDTASSR
jgi:alpha-L-fucosidase